MKISLVPLLVIATLLAFGTASAQDANSCLDKDGHSRQRIDPAHYQIAYDGKAIDLRITETVGITVGAKQQQVMSEATQRLNTSIQILVDIYNVCAISNENFQEKIDALIGYRKQADDIDKLTLVIGEMKKNKVGQVKITEKIVTLEKELQKMTDVAKVTERQLMDLRKEIRLETRAQVEGLKAEIEAELARNKVDLEKELQPIKERTSLLESRVQYLMSQLNQGKLDTTRLLFGAGVYSAYLNGEFRPQLMINGEILYPAMSKWLTGLAPVLEIGMVWWDEEHAYTTLPGLPPKTIQETQDFYFVDVGLKKYFAVRDSVDVYLGAVAGYSWQTKNEGAKGLSGNIVGGLSLYPGKYKTSLEVRYGKYPVSEKQVQFNPFGSAAVSWKTTSIDVLSLGVVFQF